MLHVTWQPPEIFNPEHRDLLTHYRVTIAPVDRYTMEQGPKKNYTVKVPGNTIKFTDLMPETIYNITVQGGTDTGYGEMLWGTYSTLATGQTHILRLKDRTPKTLTVEWDPVWGTAHKGYVVSRPTECLSIASSSRMVSVGFLAIAYSLSVTSLTAYFSSRPKPWDPFSRTSALAPSSPSKCRPRRPSSSYLTSTHRPPITLR